MKEQDIQELMCPRYKVIADYPHSSDKVGSIIHLMSHNDKSYFDQYPHLFKPLAWYEERDQSQMPEYVKRNEGNTGSFVGEPLILKIKKHFQYGEDWRERNINFFTSENGKASGYNYSNFQPATEAEYLNQQKLENKI